MKKAALFLSLALLFIVSFIFDRNISAFLTSMPGPVVNTVAIVFSFIGSTWGILVLGVLLMLFIKKKRAIPAVLISLAVTLLSTAALKLIIARARPFTLGFSAPAFLIKASYTQWDFSFPSAHAAAVFAILPWIDKKNKKLRVAWIIFGILVGLSRIILGLHWASDVIAGALIGFAISVGIKKLFKK